ncbi:hypothetical protein DFH09DRAFT_383691 [Mycena vulgaris]|nr:hypothetical protein DFH09DRAFT_383691 [Mycena vulgaris]
MRCLWLATVLSLFQLASAARTVVIDDANGDPTNGNTVLYEPPTSWMNGAIGKCSGCTGPSPQIAYMNTWHGAAFNGKNKNDNAFDNASPPTATVSFFGTSVSVQCILSNSLSNPIGTSDMTFFIDDVSKDTFSHTPTGAPGFLSNVTVFTSQPLPLDNHTLVIQNGQSGPSLIILDSITYSTSDDDAPTASRTTSPSNSSTAASVKGVAQNPNNVAAIVGAVFAVLAVLLLLALAFLYIRHRRIREHHRSNVPLSTTMVAPLGRIRSLWSAPLRPPPDMAPVPFPAPAQHIAPSPSPSPRPPPPAPSSASPRSRLSRMSFNPNLLVGRFQRRQPPPPISTIAPPEIRVAGRSAAPSPALRSGNPLLREPSTQAEPHNIVTSIQEWQLRTLQEAANQPPIHPLDMSEVDLSSHYDESSTGNPPPPPAPLPRSPQPPQRRFTVMNN